MFKVSKKCYLMYVKTRRFVKMIYSESESEADFRPAINLVSEFDSASESASESDCS